MIQINDFNASELDVYARLNETQLKHYYEPDGGIFIAESPTVILRALAAGYEPISILMEEGSLCENGRKVLELCGDIPVYEGQMDILSKITGFKLTRGMLCAMKRKDLPTVDQIANEKRRIVLLDNVVNPTNVGAIIRSAAALNMDGIVVASECSDPLYRRAIRVSMGTVFQIPWTVCDFNTAVDGLKEQGFKTVAMALKDDSVDIDNEKLCSEDKLAIILGNEGYGLSDDIIDNCDYTVKIPMSHGVDSLNVAAASAVAFWQLGKNSH